MRKKRIEPKRTAIRLKRMSDSQKGDKGNNWHGGINYKSGYRRIYMPGHPAEDRDHYISEHRYVMEKKLGRFLTKREVVHHINGNRIDNRIENLELFSSRGAHLHQRHEPDRNTMEYKAKISEHNNHMFGRHQTKESNEKRRKAILGQKRTTEQRLHMVAAWKKRKEKVT